MSDRDYGDTKYNGQIRIVSFKPDDEVQRWLHRQLNRKAAKFNKSHFYLNVFRAGIKALGAK